MSGYEIGVMSRNDVDLLVDWARRESWNPGRHDIGSFHAIDPNGFLVGRLDGEPVASISVVRYNDHFGFLGFYIVVPEHRGKGYGWAIWLAGLNYLGDRVVGLDGVVAQQGNYAKSGFALAHRNIRYGGVVTATVGSTATTVVDARTIPFDRLAALDSGLLPAPRPGFLANWISQPETVALAVIAPDGAVTGLGMLRPSEDGYRIGPLHAATPEQAEALLIGLARHTGGQPVHIDIPETNQQAVRLAERLGLSANFETARMYKGAVRDIDYSRLFAVTTLEVG